MGEWYSVIKTIKGRRYRYLQRTHRVGKDVATKNIYLGAVTEDKRQPSEPRASEEKQPTAEPQKPKLLIATYGKYRNIGALVSGKPRDEISEDDHPVINAFLARHGYDGVQFTDRNVTLDFKMTMVAELSPRRERPVEQLPRASGKLRSVPRFDPFHTMPMVDAMLSEKASFLPDTSICDEPQLRSKVRANKQVTQLLKRHNITIKRKKGLQEPYYDLDTDTIMMPNKNFFQDGVYGSATQAYYQTLFHEMIHWTVGEGRCVRDRRRNPVTYLRDRAREEMVAELGSVILMRHFGFYEHDAERLKSNAGYFQYWLSSFFVMDKTRAIGYASKEAHEAVEYILTRRTPKKRRKKK